MKNQEIPPWLANFRAKVNALPIWQFWLVFFAAILGIERFTAYFIHGTSFLASVGDAVLWASSMSFVHWLQRP